MKLSFSIWTCRQNRIYFLFCIAWSLYSVSSFLGSTELKFFLSFDKISMLLQLCVMVLSVMGVFLKRRITINKGLAIVGVMVLMALITIFTRSYGYATIACLMMLGQLADFDKIIRYDFVMRIILFFSTVSLSLIGLIPNYTAVINEVTKHAYGFVHPNTFCMIAYVILLEWLYIRWQKWNIMEFALQVMCIFLINALGGSRTTTYAYIFIFSVSMIVKLFPNLLLCKFSKAIMSLIPLILMCVSYIMIYLYGKKVRFVVKLDEIITSRFSSGFFYLTRYGFSLFGQKIETVSTRETVETGKNAMILDSAYIRLGIVMGIVFLGLFVVMYTYIIKKALDERRIELVIYVLFFLITGFSESYTLGIYNNLSLIFMMGYIARKKFDIHIIPITLLRRKCKIIIKEGDYGKVKH